jgi:predicted lipid carrier protein YhbT
MLAPLSLLNPALTLIANQLARSRPDLFARMGMHAQKTFLIDPADLPFVFTMSPDTSAPQLTAHSRYDKPRYDGAIVGRFAHLLDMIDGSLDGDALFFSRDLKVTGDTEAVVALRNALDDFDGNLVREILGAFGPLAGPAGLALRTVRALSASGGSRG